MSIRVRPAPDLEARHGATAYVPGVPADGIDLPDDEAERLLTVGLVVREGKPTKPAEPVPAKES